jgi:hypothetical protein
MSMAELSFTNFLDGAEAPTRRTGHNSNSRLRQIQAPLSHRAHRVENPAKKQHDSENHSEKHFGSEHLADEVKLQHKKNY